MTRFLLILSLAGLLHGCANRNKADVVDTSLEHKGAHESVGVRDKEFLVQDKKNLNEALRSLREQIRELEDRVYGTREYKTFGLWGKLRDCRSRVAEEKQRQFEAGPVARPSDKEYLLNWKENSDAKAGIDSKSGQLIALSEADLDDTIKRLNKIKKQLEEKEDEMSEKLSLCRGK
jgi:hypothetical protein